MSHLTTNTFSKWALLEEEELQGSIFTLDQLKVLQNNLSDKAEFRLALDFDPDKPQDFIQQEAYTKGQIELLRYLIDNSAHCQELINNQT